MNDSARGTGGAGEVAVGPEGGSGRVAWERADRLKPGGNGDGAAGETKVVSVFNHAGGAGKTSATRDLGYVLAEEGLRVLLVDADPQANLTSWLGVWGEVPLESTLHAAVMGDGRAEPDELELPEPVRAHGMDLVPSCLELAELEVVLMSQVMGTTRLKDAIGRASGSYDVVLIDCPPSLGALSALGVIASRHMVVPVQTSVKGFEGLKTVWKMIRQYRRATPDLRVATYLLTHFDKRTRHDRAAETRLRNDLSRTREAAPVSGPLSERPAIYKDASLKGVPVPLHDPGGEADREVRAAAGVLLGRLRVGTRA